jgi:2-methylcitrate dehydratase
MEWIGVSITSELAQYVSESSIQDLSDDEAHAAEKATLDAVACAIGGYEAPSSEFVRSVVEELGGREESTVIGTGIKVPCTNAALANGAMLRYLDYNDTYGITRGTHITALHISELIPAILAVGERQHSSGEEVITAIALAYELGGRFVDASGDIPANVRGWHSATLAGFIVPLCVGKLLGLTQEQIVNAVGIAGTHSATLSIIDAPGEVYTMAKNLAIPRTAQNGILATLLAKKGITGPNRIIEGNCGLVQSIMSGDYNPWVLTKRKDPPTLLQTQMKPFCAELTTQGVLSAVIQLVNAENISPEQVTEVKLEVSTRCAKHTGDPIKQHPLTKETADHSIYYLVAMAIRDRAVGPDQYTMENLKNPEVHSLIDRIIVEPNATLNEFYSAGIAHIYTRDKRELSCRIDYPRGHYLNPMTEEELAEKFRGVALRHLDEQRVQQIIETIYALQKLNDISELMQMLAFCAQS